MESLKSTVRKSKYEMIDMEKAIQIMIDQCMARFPLGTLDVDISGDVLAEDVIAVDDLPPFRASIMDGYALKTSFAKVGQICQVLPDKHGFAGDKSSELESQEYNEKQAVKVTTGGPVPSYFDAVIPVEETELVNGQGNIRILKEIKPDQFIRAKGSDIKSGQVVLEKQAVLRSAEIGLLATVGKIHGIKIYNKPRIGLLSTGNELEAADTKELLEGKIRDSNKLMIKAILNEEQIASDIVDYGIIRDNGAYLDEVMQRATNECDIVVTSGGVSMGEYDLVKPYIEQKGNVYFGRLNMKPGKPTTFGEINKALVFGLPGNPVSCFVTSYLFVVPAAKLFSGHHESFHHQTMTVQLIPRSVKLDPERPEYHRAIAIQEFETNKIYAFSTGSQLSSRLLSAKSANCLVILPKAKPGEEMYNCYHSTKAILIGQMITKSRNEINEMLVKLEGQTLKSGCCGGHHHHHHEPNTQTQSQTSQEQKPLATGGEFKVGLITVSDRASIGAYPTGDLSGRAMVECCQQFPQHYEVSSQTILADEIEDIKNELIKMSETCDVIFTSGGTGFAVRDVTPEATLQVIDRKADSLAQYMIGEAVKIVPTACLSRGVIGMRGKTMIINFPGKPKAVKENFEILMRNNVLIHAIKFLKGTASH